MIDHDDARTIFLAGFAISGEGFNGEYINRSSVGAHDESGTTDNVERAFELWYQDYSVLGREMDPAEVKIVDGLADSIRMTSRVSDGEIRDMALRLYGYGWRQVAFNV